MHEQREPRPREAPLAFAVYLVFGLAAVAVIGGLLGVRRYTNHSSRFCESCHEVAPEARIWLESEHQDISCQECHHATVREGLAILSVYLLGQMPDVEHAAVRVRSCAGCHASHDRRWPEVANSIGHRSHAQPAGLHCTDCHGQEMHFGETPRPVCMSCHEGRDTGPAHEPMHCLACHDFMSTSDELRPRSRECMSCHAKQDRPILMPPTAPMHFVCAGCHEPHAAGRIAPCSDCHGPRELRGGHEHPDHQLCADCHEPHEWTSQQRHCSGCHKDLYSHHPEKRCESCHRFDTGASKSRQREPTR
jgi:hypothetical protein